MKKILGLVLVLFLLLSISAASFAAGKPTITKQPQTATTNKKGSVSFSVSYKGSVDSITWYFVNPVNGEKYSGKKIRDVFKNLKVSSPNGKKITLSKVPAEMHGWTVYCHLNGNGYKVDSDSVMLLVEGMDVPGAPAELEAPAEPEAPAQPEAPAEPEAPDEPEAPAQSEQPADSSVEAVPEGPVDEFGQPMAEGDPDRIPDNTVIVNAGGNYLWKLDNSGNTVDDGPSATLEFVNQGSFLVRSDDPIRSWSVNGIRIEPAQPINEFRMLNISENIVLDLDVIRSTSATADVDSSTMCKVTCQGCTFTYLSAGLISVTEGEVPAGAPIRIVADSADLAAGGYRINGADPVNSGKASFRFTVTEDVSIKAE